MEHENASDKIQEAIHKLEEQQAQEETGLKDQLQQTYESIKPANLIKNTLHSVISNPDVQHDLTSGAISLAAGYAAKKLIIGDSESTASKIAGTLLELGIARVVASHEQDIRLIGMAVYQAIRDKYRARRLASQGY